MKRRNKKRYYHSITYLKQKYLQRHGNRVDEAQIGSFRILAKQTANHWIKRGINKHVTPGFISLPIHVSL